MNRNLSLFGIGALALGYFVSSSFSQDPYTVRSTGDGPWSDPGTWGGFQIPKASDRVLITRGTTVIYDLESDEVIHSVRVAGTLRFAKDRNTLLNVGDLRVQPGEASDAGAGVEDIHKKDGKHGHKKPMPGHEAVLEVGAPGDPIPHSHRAMIRLHYIEGEDETKSPAIICRPGGRMEFHGAPMNRTWVKLDANAKPGELVVSVAEKLTGWRPGDSVIITGSERFYGKGSYLGDPVEREIDYVDGLVVALKPANPKKGSQEIRQGEYWGEGEFRSEIANLSRNVVIESADPDGVRGHTMYHWESAGSISYARFAHLGKENTLGRYPIHFHLVEDSLRGSSVIGAAIVGSHNRWVTVHGTHYMVVRDCVGYGSLGHGFFLEDATEVYNLLDRNLAVGAKTGPRMKGLALPFDPNDGAGFWWANGKNTFSRNVATANEEYGYRYDCQMTSRFDCRLPIRQPDGSVKKVDVRTIPIWRFEDNEAHTEGTYGMVVAANGGRQPDNAIRDNQSLRNIQQIDWTGPDRRHPHRIKGLKVWEAHYAFRPHSPNMLMEDIRLHEAAYGIYRPAFENHVYRNLHISNMGAEPFNRGMDDTSAQTGTISVDGLTFEHGYGNKTTPLIQISDNNLSGGAATHLRNVTVKRPEEFKDRWPLINRGVGPRVPPVMPGVPIYLHDHFGKGRHAKVVSTAAKYLISDGNEYREIEGLTGNEARAAEVADVPWPKDLLEPVDDEPPATIILSVKKNESGALVVRGVSHDNGEIESVKVNGEPVSKISRNSGVADWSVTIPISKDGKVTALATDDAGNAELTPHELTVR